MNLGWTQEQWIDFFEKFGPLTSIYYTLYDQVLLMEENETYFWERFGDQFYDWQLSGVKLGESTDGNGRIHLVVSALYGGTTVSLYNNSVRTYPYLIAQGTRAGVGTVTLLEMNSSGVTGTVEMDDTTASSILYLDVVQGILAQISNLAEWDSYDAQVKALLKTLAPNITGTFENGMRIIIDAIRDIFRNFVPDKMEIAERSVVMFVETQAVDGTVTVEFTGVGKYLINCMGDELVAGAQLVLSSSPWLITDTVDAGNTGSGTLDWTPYDHARLGMFTLECVSGGVVGAEEFEVSQKTDDGVRVVGTYRLKVDGIFRSIGLGISSMLLTRDIVEDSDPENRFSAYSATGVDANNSDGGGINLVYDRVGDIVYAYSDAARTILVAKAIGISAGAPVVATLTEENDSGLTIQVTFNGVDPSTDLYNFRALASVFAENDRLYSLLEEEVSFERGKINTFLGRVFGLVLPSGVNTIPDGIVDRGFGRRSDRWI